MKRFLRSKLVLWFAVGMIVLVVGSSILARLSTTTQEPPDSVLFEQDIVYSKVGGKSLSLDLARPKMGTGPFPVIVCIHGGGWRAGDKKEFHGLLFGLAQQGYVAATVNYRMAPDDHFPSPIQDVKTAVRYLRSRAKELKIDPDRFGVFGGSAGGHLALLLGTTGADDFPPVVEYPGHSSAVQAVVALAGPTDLTRKFPEASEWMVTGLIGKTRDEDPGLYERASPLHHVSAKDAPVLAIHGTKDDLVPYEQSTALADALKKVGVEVELFTVEGGGHGSGGKPEDWAAGIRKMVGFFSKHLKPSSDPAPPQKP